jgi:hypothetical protein
LSDSTYILKKFFIVKTVPSTGVKLGFDESVELAVNERDAAYKVWHDNINRVRRDRLWILYVQKRRYASGP